MSASDASIQSKNSLAGMELLAEEQALAIRQLELKLKKMEEDNQKLIEKQKTLEVDLSAKEADAIERFVVSDARLAHIMTVLPVKRRRTSLDFDIGYGDGNDDEGETLEEKSQEKSYSMNYFDPALDFVYQKAYESAQAGKSRLQQSYDDLIAWKFTPDSTSGKRLMACMRQLLKSNKHLGAINQLDRLTTLESETEMQALCIREYLKTSQELNSVLQESSTDLDGVQSSLFVLKKQLNKAEELINALKEEYEMVYPGQSDDLIATALATLSQQAMTVNSEDTKSIKEGFEDESKDFEVETNPSSESPAHATSVAPK